MPNLPLSQYLGSGAELFECEAATRRLHARRQSRFLRTVMVTGLLVFVAPALSVARAVSV